MNETIPPGNIELVAPISGIITPLKDVPDPTFSEKMLGDGIAIDPTGETLSAPCAGAVTQLHKSRHALTITTPEGVEILMHIGLETVLLKGEGFTPKVREGDTVAVGDPLIAFDADYLAKNAVSLLVLMVVTNGGAVQKYLASQNMAEGGKTPILLVQSEKAAVAAGSGDASATGAVLSDPIAIPNPAGFHARPAGVLANSAKQFSASIRLRKGNREANAKSLVSVMKLEVEHNDTVTLEAVGPDAGDAIAKLVPLIRSGLGDDLSGAPPKPAAPFQEKPPRPVSDNPNMLLGVSASPGMAAGNVFQLRHAEVSVVEKGRGVEAERASLLKALDEAKKEIVEIQENLKKRGDSGKAAIFVAHQELLEDPELINAAQQGIREDRSAAFAWKTAFTQQAETLGKLGNELLAGRANDIRDVGRRVLGHLAGIERKAADLPANVILIAENLTPSDTAGLDKTKVLGFATTGGSATSHVAILARAASIPAVAAVEERALEIPDGAPVILDGGKGEIQLNPTPDDMRKVKELQAALSQRRKLELAQAQEHAVTTDNHRLKVVGNIGGAAEAKEIPELGGEGVGLLRSEFLFLQRSEPPSIEEQAAVYTTVAKTLGKDRDLVVRTLDVGGDKPLAYLPLPPEENPFLGVRGIRLNLMDRNLMTAQVRAILRAAPFTRLCIMFPMVATIEELREAKDIVAREKEALDVREKVEVGIMVEVPSAAILAEQFAREADFFSIGTNDLTQYTLAVDRGHPRLAKMADGLHPAVLSLIGKTVEGAHKHGKWVGVCGGLASEIPAVPLLVGLGVDELSVTVSSIPAIKAVVRRLNFGMCRELAREAVSMVTAREVRERVAEFLGE